MVLTARSVSVRQTIRSLRFWQQAKCDDELAALTYVSRPIPQDPEDGLARASQVLRRTTYYGMINETWLFCILIFFRMFLNIYTIMGTLQVLVHPNKVSVHEGIRGYNITLTKTSVIECFHGDCYSHPVSRLRAWYMMTVFEALFVIPFAIFTILLVLTFVISKLLCSQPPSDAWPEKETEETQRSWLHALPYNRPWFFILAPRHIAGFSSITFLAFCSPRAVWSIAVRGLGEFNIKFILASTFPQCFVDRYKERLSDRKLKRSLAMSRRRWFGAALLGLLCVALALCSLQSLIVKLTHLHFVASLDFREWTLTAWILFMGFVNQIVGAFEFIDPELNRLVLFIFGGADSRLGRREMTACLMYFRLVARKVTEQCDVTGPLSVVAQLACLTVDSLQGLVLSEYRDQCIEMSGTRREEFAHELNTSSDAREYFNNLQEALKKQMKLGQQEEAQRLLILAKTRRLKSLKKLRDDRLKEAWKQDDEDEVCISEKLRLVLETQVRIEECSNLTFEGVDPDSSDVESESGTEISSQEGVQLV